MMGLQSRKMTSLNDCLEIGTNHIPLTFDMLAKFRLNQVGHTADIEQAFLMVGIKEENRDMLRFLYGSKIRRPGVPKSFSSDSIALSLDYDPLSVTNLDCTSRVRQKWPSYWRIRCTSTISSLEQILSRAVTIFITNLRAWWLKEDLICESGILTRASYAKG